MAVLVVMVEFIVQPVDNKSSSSKTQEYITKISCCQVYWYRCMVRIV